MAILRTENAFDNQIFIDEPFPRITAMPEGIDQSPMESATTDSNGFEDDGEYLAWEVRKALRALFQHGRRRDVLQAVRDFKSECPSPRVVRRHGDVLAVRSRRVEVLQSMLYDEEQAIERILDA